MNRLTPEIYAISTFNSVSGQVTAKTRELDFNLARRSAVIINQIRGVLTVMAATTTGFDAAGGAVQELDLDPDNLVVWEPASIWPEAVELDSSRVFRQHHGRSLDTAAGAVSMADGSVKMDWTNLPMEQRPISITNMRHHLRHDSAIDNTVHAELYIKYFIVELNLLELGIINASRR